MYIINCNAPNNTTLNWNLRFVSSLVSTKVKQDLSSTCIALEGSDLSEASMSTEARNVQDGEAIINQKLVISADRLRCYRQ